jgi:hypothetical protein
MYGRGTGTSDDIVTRVSNGEYVVRERAARAIGYDTLDALNQADRRPVALGGGGGSSAAVGSVDRRSRQQNAELAEMIVRGFERVLRQMPRGIDAGRTADLFVRGG